VIDSFPSLKFFGGSQMLRNSPFSSTSTPLQPYQRAPSKGTSVWYMGSLLTFLAESKDSGSNFSFFEVKMRPGNEPPPHVHENEDELYYILEGEIDTYVGSSAFHLTPGTCMFLPRRQPHTFRILSPELRMLFLTQPGGLEGYFRAMSTSAADELTFPPRGITYSNADIEYAIRTGADYGIRFLSDKQVADQMPPYVAAIKAAPKL
jgi:mannose-6-phosphate isomerase-like protein (cupin superfamily)